MTNLLHLDASARSAGEDHAGASSSSVDDGTPRVAFGSRTRRLTARFVARWRASRPDDSVTYRDIGRDPPTPVSEKWIQAAFTPPERGEPWMRQVLADSDALIDELIRADLVIAGVPMYNFSVPAQFKAYIDNIIRVGRTFGFDRSRVDEPFFPLLTDKHRRLIVVTARGNHGYDDHNLSMNHVEAGIRSAFGYIGIRDISTVAVEYDVFADKRLCTSIQRAEQRVDALVDGLLFG